MSADERELPAGHGIARTVLFTELCQAVKADEDGEGCDLAAGVGGPNVAKLVSKIVTDYFDLAHSRAQDSGGEAVRNREADRARFSDSAFNRWLDDGISDCGHTVYDAIDDVCSAWHGWSAHETYVALQQPDPLPWDDATPPPKVEAQQAMAINAARYRQLILELFADDSGVQAAMDCPESLAAYLDAALAHAPQEPTES